MQQNRISRLRLPLLAMLCFFISACQKQMGGVLNPKGLIAFQERQLMFDALALMLIVVIPVIVMSFAFVFRYRASHHPKEYRPNWAHNHFLEAIWWGVPCVIIMVLGILTWKMTHRLDPYRPLNVPGKPMVVEAVALPWQWLFIYPDQNLASVNYLVLPKHRQIHFVITTDNVPMSAFFIPQLGSQIYTMAGMRTQLNLVAGTKGKFDGFNAQYNGDGFSDMHFTVDVVDENGLKAWFELVKRTGKSLTDEAYNTLRQPRAAGPVQYFSSVTPHLFKRIIRAYSAPKHPEKLPSIEDERNRKN